MKNNYISQTTRVLFFLVFILFLNSAKSQNFQNVAVTAVSTGSGTANALFVATSPTIPSLKFIRAQRINVIGNSGTFILSGDNIRYINSGTLTGIPANKSRIRFTFLQADGITLIAVNDFRFVIDDLDGPNNEALATDCGTMVRFAGVAEPTDISVDQTPPDLNAVSAVDFVAGGIRSRVMYEFNDVSIIEFDSFANGSFSKTFDMNQNNFAIANPRYFVCLQDTDGDGKNDAVDLDDDNDGILDSVETGGNNPNGDQDGDGLPNYLDTVNNSGATTFYVARADGSTTNYTDADADGVPDVYESSSDSDSLPNHLDLDSDNDGCSDSNEYYNNNTSAAIGQQFGQTGGAVAPTNANGTVIAASYAGTYINAITVGNVVTTQPANQVTVFGGNTVFSVTIPVSGTVIYQWQESTNGGVTFINIPNTGIYSGATTASLTLTGVTSTQNGYDYRVVITKSDYVCGSIFSTSADLIVTPQSNVGVVKSVNNANPNFGNNVIFSIVAKNDGPSSATNVAVNDLLPTGYTYVNSTPSVGTYTVATGVWNIGTLVNGESQILSITATVNATGNFANTATISATEADPTPVNNSSTSTPTPTASSNLGVTKSVDNPTPAAGSNVVFTIVANNQGPSTATGVNVNDLLQTGYTFVSSTVTAGTYDNVTGVWAIGNLADGTIQTLTVTATVKATGNYANTATISGAQPDATPGNNSSTSTPVLTPANVGDNDNDGIPDITDIDDDNDGIPDSVECGFTTCPQPFINGSFELPTNPVTPPNYYLPAASLVPGWDTDDSLGQIELWTNGFLGVPSFDGNQIAELNANSAGTLSQSLCIKAGTIVNWSVRHHGRVGVDVAVVKIGNDLASASVQATMTDGASPAPWGLYSGSYTAPTGSTSTLFAFQAISSNGGIGNNAEGNLIDDIKITFSSPAGCLDTDGDGIVNAFDIDSDNDGLFDLTESGSNPNLDLDNNGIIDGTVQPNGLPTALGGTPITPVNTDSDGIADYLDLDSDNDGIYDLTESGNGSAIASDTNNDGTISNTESPSGTNGVPLSAEITEGAPIAQPTDTDGDGIPNNLELDSDNDGCSDSNEYYNNNTSAATGQQFGQTGGAVAPSNPNGAVTSATYIGNYTNVITNSISIACLLPIATNDPVTYTPGTSATINVLANDTTGDTVYQQQ